MKFNGCAQYGDIVQNAYIHLLPAICNLNKKEKHKLMKAATTLLLLTILSITILGQNSTITIEEFKKRKLWIFEVKSSLDTLKIKSFDPKNNNNIVSHNIILKQNKGLGVWTTSYLSHFSINTVPIKIRPALDNFPQSAFTGLNNAGINFGIYNKRLDRYFFNNKKSSHFFSAGLNIGPSIEELTPENTNNYILTKNKQLFITGGISLTYSYNDISFTIIPMAYDFATTKEGREYIYNSKMWWGFGFGIKTSLLGYL
jgi:hypothetical protein